MSDYYMMDGWGIETEEPTQKPLSVNFNSWKKDRGIGRLQVRFLKGHSLKHLNIPDPIEMEWDEDIVGGGWAWELEGSPTVDGPRNSKGIRRKWAYDACTPPLYHKDLIKALQKCGVDNLETFNVRIVDIETDEVCEGYQAVNIVGLIKAADMAQSVVTEHSTGVNLFDSVKLNESSIRGQLMFRLAESANAVIIHAKVKEYLESKGGFELTFTQPEKWVG